jgi:hypothetical protein
MWPRFVPGTTKCLHPDLDTGPVGGFPAGQTGVSCEGGNVKIIWRNACIVPGPMNHQWMLYTTQAHQAYKI